jgi:hypothetical protein
MADVHLPMSDGKKLILPQYTHPKKRPTNVAPSSKLPFPNPPLPKVTAEDLSHMA